MACHVVAPGGTPGGVMFLRELFGVLLAVLREPGSSGTPPHCCLLAESALPKGGVFKPGARVVLYWFLGGAVLVFALAAVLLHGARRLCCCGGRSIPRLHYRK